MLVHTTVRVRDAHPDYLAAKSGQREAAVRLARDLLLTSAVDRLREDLAGATPTLVAHTRANGFHRLAFQPTFAGAVTAGASYVLIDDHVGLGSTLANLRGHLERRGGSVVHSTTLSASRASEVLALRASTLHALRERHGESLDTFWREQLGFGVELLTEAEAGYLLRTASLDAIRAGIALARGS